METFSALLAICALLQSNTVAHWLGANLESALYACRLFDTKLI